MINKAQNSPDGQIQPQPAIVQNEIDRSGKSSVVNDRLHEQGWSKPLPYEELPAPTFWPIVLAFGMMLLFWGLVSSMIITGFGFVLMVISVSGWVHEILKEHKKQEQTKNGK
jgi:hypothetical protein